MWRKATFAGNYDSDQSISEDEDLASDWPENCIALCGTEERKEQIQIQSQLDVLRDTHERDHGIETTTMSNKRQKGFVSDEEVEFPVFHDNGGFISSPRVASLCDSEEEIISDNENLQEAGLHCLEIEKGSCTWSAVSKEAEALAHLTESARCSSLHAIASKENKQAKGCRGKSKSKFLFHFQSHKEDIPLPVSSNPEVNMPSKFIPFVQGLEAVDHSTTANSMAELLDSYQEKTNSKMCTCMEAQGLLLVDESSVPPLGKREMDNVNPLEDLDTESSTDDGISHQDSAQNLGLIVPESVQKAMSDKFQEAFGAASANEEELYLPLHGIGLFAKLQRIMQREKKTELDFMKKLEIGANLEDEPSCFDVEILSRCLEAKLTVCCCSLRRDNEEKKRRMEYRPFEVVIISAKGLKDIGHLSKMDVYVIATISGDPRTLKTPVDKDGGSCPSWDFTMKFTIDEIALQANCLNLVFQLRHERTLHADKDIGEVHVPIKELLGNAAGDNKPAILAEYPVRNPSGKEEGTLKFSFKFGPVYSTGAGTGSIHPPPVIVLNPNNPPALPAGYPPAMPFQPPQLPAGYPPPPMGQQYGYSGYPPPPPAGALYPPMQPGYGYSPVQQQHHPPRRNHYAQSAGLVGALIGAMVIEENLGN